MPAVKYIGPFDAVEIPDLALTCKQGKTIDVPAHVADNLVLQHDWELAPTKPVKES